MSGGLGIPVLAGGDGGIPVLGLVGGKGRGGGAHMLVLTRVPPPPEDTWDQRLGTSLEGTMEPETCG